MQFRESRGRSRTALRRLSRGLGVAAGVSALAAAVSAQAAAAEPPAEPPADSDGAATDKAESNANPGTDVEAGYDDTGEAEAVPPTTEEAPKPPRIDGPYLGAVMFGGIGLVRLNNLETDGPFVAMGGTMSVGQMVFPWLGLGLHGGGGGGVRSQDGARQRLGQGHIGMEFRFVPLPKRLPLSLAASFGFGGGAVRQAGIDGRAGFGGAQFGASARYEWFPGASRYRATRGGGLGLGPQIGWIGFTPAAKGRPMSNVFYLGLSTTFYFGS